MSGENGRTKTPPLPMDMRNEEGSGSESEIGDGSEAEDDGTAEENSSEEVDEGGSEGENSDDSLDGTLEKCPICLRVIKQQEIATPDSCEHTFCLKCILEWADNVTTCPIDRKTFHSVLIMDKVKGNILRVQELVPPACQRNAEYDEFSDPTFCEICGCCDREDRLLLCDDCDMGYHLECLDPPLQFVPIDDWYCTTCTPGRAHVGRNEEAGSSSSSNWTRPSRTRIPRTGLSRRIMIRRRRDASPSPIANGALSQTETGSTRNRSSSYSRTRKAPVRRRKRKTVRKRSGSGVGKRRGRRKRTRKQRVVLERRPATPRGRLVQQLGILPPRPGQVYVGLPSYRATYSPTTEKSTSAASIRNQRHQAGIAPLRIYATVNDLADYFEGSSDDEGGVGVMRPQAIRIGDSRKRVLASATSQQALNANVLGPILSRQHILLQDKNMQIQSADGTLVPSISVNPERLWRSPSSNNENDSSGYDSFGNRGSPPQFRSRGNQNVTVATANGGSPSSSTTNPREGGNENSRRNSGEPNTSGSSIQQRMGSVSGNFRNNTNNPTSLGGYNSNEATNTFEDFSGLDEHLEKTSTSKKSNKDKDDKDDDDEEFNIYSDIEDEPRIFSRRISDDGPVAVEITECTGLDGGAGGDSENEMVIDEAEGGPIGLEERISIDSITLPSSDLLGELGEAEGISPNGSSPALPEMEQPDSPLSIPLPDSTPPPSVRDMPNFDDEDTHDLSFDEMPKDDEDKEKDLVTRKDEYDPSQPLTSSEDDEEPILVSGTTISTEDRIPSPALLDVSAIPMPNEEYRRPTIQFSIPSRHRIFSVGSLIRRNKGVVKKEPRAGSSISFQSEMSKAFTLRKGDEAGGSESEKVSLVAEIFGSDEDEEDESTPRIFEPLIPQQSLATPILQNIPALEFFQGNSQEPILSTDTRLTGTKEVHEVGKWRKIVDDEIDDNTPQIIEEEDDDVVVIGETPPEVQIIETPPPESEDEGPMRREEHKLKCTTQSESENTMDAEKEERKEIPGFLDSLSDSETDFERERLREKELIGKKKEDERRLSLSPKKDKENKRTGKRRRSVSGGSNCEEGEILDIPDKKRKKGKKSKKSKKRRRSTRSRSSSSSERVNFSEKKIPQETHGLLTSEEEDEEKGVCWKKPSKSSKERNYRDRKPKSEEKYFREREKKQEEEASDNFRNRSIEKSPPLIPPRGRDDVEKERGRKEEKFSSTKRRSRSRGKRAHSKHSNRSSSSLRNVRSRSRSGHSRSSKPQHERRHRQHSPSPNRSPPNRSRNTPDRSRPRRTSHRSRTRSPSKRQRRRSRSETKSRPTKLRSVSHSGSRSPSPRTHRKKKERPSLVPERIPIKKTRKEGKETKEKVSKEKVTSSTPPPPVEPIVIQPKEKPSGDKEKKKKRKRREKSISPAKAIFADGDSIVVSLNFQKGKEASTASGKESVLPPDSGKDEVGGEKKKGSRAGSYPRERSEKPKPLKKTILIDLEASPVLEQNIGVSPTLIVLSDDEEMHVKGNESDQDRVAVSTTSLGDGGKSPHYRDGHGVPADSTQIHLQIHSNDKHGGEFSHGRTNSRSESEAGNTPARGDALVTSTRDSVDRNGIQDDYTLSPFTPPKDSSSPNDMSMTPPLPPGSPPPPLPMHDQLSKTQPQQQSTSLGVGTVTTTVAPLLPVSGTTLPSRPLGISNNQGILPSTSKIPLPSTVGMSVPVVPVVISTPPITQLRLPPPNLFNQSVLATVANALYGPLMGGTTRYGIPQQQPQQQQPMVGVLNPTNQQMTSRLGPHVMGKKFGSGGSVLLPKDQNYATRRREGGGDSPFSPNSSDGDDLFEPPKDSTHDGGNSSKSASGTNSAHKGEKGDGDVGVSGGKPKGRATTQSFDTIFGGSIKKQPTGSHGKGNKSSKSKSSHHKSKSRKGGHKKAIVKMNEGELRLTEEVPTSAVELRVKEKFLKKLNRQERVVEEVKVSLKPHYSKKHITKDEYKDILRRAVPKICHNKSGEINPLKIRELVEAYVKKVRKTRKK